MEGVPDFEEDPDAPKQKPPSMSEIFERLCPRYMLYGMTYEQYWYGDPWAMKAYKEADNLRNRRQNEFEWIQGIYFADALATVIGNAFSKKGTPPKKYMQKPLDIFPKTDAEIEAEKEAEQRKIIAMLTAWKRLADADEKNKAQE